MSIKEIEGPMAAAIKKKPKRMFGNLPSVSTPKRSRKKVAQKTYMLDDLNDKTIGYYSSRERAESVMRKRLSGHGKVIELTPPDPIAFDDDDSDFD